MAGAPEGFAAVVLHNLAFIDLREGLFAACVERLSPHMERPDDIQALPDPAERALQLLWLRALHRTGGLERACAWAKRADVGQALDQGAAGVASLIAIDASDLVSARRWVAMALKGANLENHPAPPIEAFVTQATLCLAQRQAGAAIEWSDRALALNPQDGRAWSARAFALMLDGKLGPARLDFTRALEAMPGHIGTWHGQGWAELLMHDVDAAEKSFNTALALDRNFAESHGSLAVVMALKRRTEPAREHAEIALRIDRTNMSGRYAQAILEGGVGDAEAIRKLAHRLLSSRDNAKGQNLSEMADGLF
jgi:tetratricopeptide (TPR) repeat protein